MFGRLKLSQNFQHKPPSFVTLARLARSVHKWFSKHVLGNTTKNTHLPPLRKVSPPSNTPATSMASHSDLLAIKIHPRFQDKCLRLAIQLMIVIIIVTSIYKWLKNLKTPYNNSKTTGAKYIHFLLTGNPQPCQNML
ncbi:hypothetical protein VP01_842g2 [Puccinia sorghi]|uniref:Uncharacterized protein n=1 Tax=Puccinia sorghi TaxID=27349 RepID=A0A0L6U9B6_9BASI|nr:hypothetical protein VP01_842g2 [Puccinia sorghi]